MGVIFSMTPGEHHAANPFPGTAISVSNLERHGQTSDSDWHIRFRQLPLGFAYLLHQPVALSFHAHTQFGPFISTSFNGHRHWFFAREIVRLSAPSLFNGDVLLLVTWRHRIQLQLAIKNLTLNHAHRHLSARACTGHGTWTPQGNHHIALTIQQLNTRLTTSHGKQQIAIQHERVTDDRHQAYSDRIVSQDRLSWLHNDHPIFTIHHNRIHLIETRRSHLINTDIKLQTQSIEFAGLTFPSSSTLITLNQSSHTPKAGWSCWQHWLATRKPSTHTIPMLSKNFCIPPPFNLVINSHIATDTQPITLIASLSGIPGQLYLHRTGSLRLPKALLEAQLIDRSQWQLPTKATHQHAVHAANKQLNDWLKHGIAEQLPNNQIQLNLGQ